MIEITDVSDFRTLVLTIHDDIDAKELLNLCGTYRRGNSVIISTDDKSAVAMYTVVPNSDFRVLEYFYVAPYSRAKGVGTSLLQYITDTGVFIAPECTCGWYFKRKGFIHLSPIYVHTIRKVTGAEVCIACHLYSESIAHVWPYDELDIETDVIQPETITCAAIRYQTKDMPTPAIVCGHRHSDCVAKFKAMDIPLNKRKETQGFMTSYGRFLNREASMYIARSAGQTSATHKELCSEDIY